MRQRDPENFVGSKKRAGPRPAADAGRAAPHAPTMRTGNFAVSTTRNLTGVRVPAKPVAASVYPPPAGGSSPRFRARCTASNRERAPSFAKRQEMR